MDLQLFARVLWRFRFLVLIGLGVALAAAFLLFVRVELDPSGEPRLYYREHEEWSVKSTLLVTQPGFPWGRSILDPGSDELEALPSAEPSETEDEFADPTRFSTLAPLYARLATSGAVHRLMLQDGPVDGEIEARPVLLVDNSSVTLPLVELVVTADTPEGSLALTRRAIDAFDTFLSSQQIANSVPPNERVIVTVVDQPEEAELSRPRPLTFPVVAFLGVILTTLAVVFALENLWPRTSVTSYGDVSPRRAA